MRYLAVTIIVLMSSMQTAAAAEPILITFSDDMSKVVFDGKWTVYTEWKHSSLNTLSYDDGTVIQLRSAHQGDFIYIFADVITDSHFVRGSDTAMLCFDRNDNKTILPDSDDYCFMTALGGKRSFAYQGGSPLGFNGNFKQIPNPEGFIGIGGVSDNNDRYTPVSHSGYEFKIPTSIVGRSSSYGFFFTMYDAYLHKFYSWPEDVKIDKPFQIPSPSLWGDLISPDKSLPEFPWPVLVLVFAFSTSVFLGNKKFSHYGK